MLFYVCVLIPTLIICGLSYRQNNKLNKLSYAANLAIAGYLLGEISRLI